MPSNKDFYDALTNLSLSADSVNLNVDQVEGKLDTANGLLTTLSADIALIKPDVDDIRVDLANGVTINQPVAVTDNAGSLTVDGTVTANAGTGTFVVSSTQLPSVLASDRLKVDGSGVTQPVSGTITANAGTGSFNVAQATAASLNATVVQGTATNLKTQAEVYQGGSAVASGNPLQVTIANTGANSTAIKTEAVKGSSASVTTFTATTNSQILSSNSSRKCLTIFNSTPNVLYVRLGSGAVSSGDYSFAIGEKELLSLSNITTEVRGIYAISGTAYVTEIT